MVDSIKPTYPSMTIAGTSRRKAEASEVESHSNNKQYNPVNWDGRERRRGKDRRDEQAQKRGDPFETRNSRGRRKEDRKRFPHISTKA